MTVKELAAAAGKSEAAVRARLKKMNAGHDERGHYIITPDICQEILSAYGISQEEDTRPATDEALTILAEQLKEKDRQIQNLQDQLAAALKLIDQQQQLTAARLPLFKRKQRKQIAQDVSQ